LEAQVKEMVNRVSEALARDPFATLVSERLAPIARHRRNRLELRILEILNEVDEDDVYYVEEVHSANDQ